MKNLKIEFRVPIVTMGMRDLECWVNDILVASRSYSVWEWEDNGELSTREIADAHMFCERLFDRADLLRILSKK